MSNRIDALQLTSCRIMFIPGIGAVAILGTLTPIASVEVRVCVPRVVVLGSETIKLNCLNGTCERFRPCTALKIKSPDFCQLRQPTSHQNQMAEALKQLLQMFLPSSFWWHTYLHS